MATNPQKEFSLRQTTLLPGQALLMVVVAMVIILTISLSVATQSIVNVRTSSEEESSSVAFSAAEAGIEKYLKNAQEFTGTIGTSNVTVNIVPVGGTTSITLNNGNPVLRDDGADVWLSTFPGYAAPYWSGVMRVHWNRTSGCSDPDTTAALEVLVITGPQANPLSSPSITRRVYDPCQGTRGGAAGNHFPAPDNTSGVDGYGNYSNIIINAASPGIIARMIPLYANTVVAVTAPGNQDFPQQGSVVSSVGTSGSTTRKIVIYKGYPKVPAEFFQYTLFSP
ncbi:MAG: hypothetical protein HYV40_06610 [Candidatus Levybacteria bacterium]|nr:hypothetical protein [Candidatus Levybacteria bacterium]